MRPPKAFVSDKAAQQLWRSRFGDFTAVQIRAVMGADIQTTQTNFQRQLLDKIRPEQVGLVFQPVKTDGLAAATGSTNFSSLLYRLQSVSHCVCRFSGGVTFQTRG